MAKIFYDLKETDNIETINNMIKNCKLLVVDFYADWCGPCIKLGKEIEDKIMNEKFSENIENCDVMFVKINIDVHPEIAQIYKIKSIPHIIFYNKGKLQQDIIKGCDYDAVINKIKNQLCTI